MPHQCTNCGKVFDDGSKEMLSGCPNCGGNKFQFQPAQSRGQSSRSDATNDTRGAEPTSRGGADSDQRGTAADPTDGETSGERRGSRPDESPSTADGRDDSAAASSSGTNATAPAGGRDRTTGSTADAASDRTDDDSRSVRSRIGDWIGSDERSSANARSTADERTTENRGHRRRADAGDAAGAGSPEDSAQASARSDVVSPDELEAAADSSAPSGIDVPPGDVDGEVIEPETEDRPDLEELRQELNNQFESIKIVSPGQYELNLMELYDRQEYIISLREDGRYVIEVPDTWEDLDG